MATQVGSIYFDLDVNTAKFKSDLNSAELSAKGMSDNSSMSMGRMSSAMAIGGIAANVATQAFGYLKAGITGMVTSANEAEAVQTKMVYLLRNSTTVTEAQIQALTDWASTEQYKLGIDDEAIKNGIAMLGTFKLQGSAIQETIPVLANLARAYQTSTGEAIDLQSWAIKIGKAEALPELAAQLRRIGIVFSQNDIDMMKNMTESERVLAITGELKKEFGELGYVIGDTNAGKIQRLTVYWGEFKEAMGTQLMTVISPIVDKLLKMAEASGGVEVMVKRVIPILLTLAFVIGTLLVGATIAWTVALLANPITLVVAGIALVIAGVVWLIQKMGGVEVVLKKLKPTVDMITGALKSLWGTIQTQLVPSLTKLWQENKDWLIPTLKFLGYVIGVIIVGYIMFLIKYIQLLVIAWTWIADGVRVVVNYIRERIQQIGVEMSIVTEFIKQKITDFLAFWTSVWNTAKDIFRQVFEVIKAIIYPFYAVWMVILIQISGAVTWVVGKIIEAWRNLYNMMVAIMTPIYGFFAVVFGSVWGFISNVAGWIVGKFQWVYGAVSGAIRGIWGTVAEVFNVIWGHINNIGNWISNKFNGVANAVSGAFSGLGNGLKNTLNGMIGIVNIAIRAFNKLPGPDIGEIPKFASGVNNFMGGLAIVGEQGPELVSLPRGSTVHPNGESMTTATFTGDIYLGDKTAVDEFFKRLSRNQELAQKGLATL